MYDYHLHYSIFGSTIFNEIIVNVLIGFDEIQPTFDLGFNYI